jgi:hypothetical protein
VVQVYKFDWTGFSKTGKEVDSIFSRMEIFSGFLVIGLIRNFRLCIILRKGWEERAIQESKSRVVHLNNRVFF